MKCKLLSALLLTICMGTLPACKKQWQCTCSATLVGTSPLNIDTVFYIPETNRPTAQGDCDVDCSMFSRSSSYTNVTAKITAE